MIRPSEKGLNMGNKAFLVLVAIAILLGAGLGGAFAAGIAVGRSQDNGQAANGASTDTPAFTPPRAQEGLQEITPEQIQQFRQQLGEGGGLPLGGAGGFPFGGGELAARALTGNIESIDGNVITVNTPQGPLQATLSEDTGIQVFSQGTPQDLEVGQQVVIRGERNEEGVIQATDVMVTPEGDLFGGGFLGAGGGRRLP